MKKLAIAMIALFSTFLLLGCIGGETGPGGTGQVTSSEAQIDQQIDQQLGEIGDMGTELDNLLNP